MNRLFYVLATSEETASAKLFSEPCSIFVCTTVDQAEAQLEHCSSSGLRIFEILLEARVVVAQERSKSDFLFN